MEVQREQLFSAVALTVKLQCDGLVIRISNAELYAMAQADNIPIKQWSTYVRRQLEVACV